MSDLESLSSGLTASDQQIVSDIRKRLEQQHTFLLKGGAFQPEFQPRNASNAVADGIHRYLRRAIIERPDFGPIETRVQLYKAEVDKMTDEQLIRIYGVASNMVGDYI